ncbi:MAG: DUF3592 domain-containing protein [Chloroflexi bacterium]|nr:DUF3592 domain-containing protein [Chloroflexota bacterium]
MPITGCLLSFGSIIMLVGAVFAFIRQRQKFIERIFVKGVVVSLERRSSTSSDHSSGFMFYPVIEFRTASGENVQFESDFGSMPASFSVGQSVKVAYDPANPDKAEIDSAVSRYLVTTILGFMGLVILCIGAVFLLMGLFISLGAQ